MTTLLWMIGVIGMVTGIAGGFFVPQKGTEARRTGFILWVISDIAVIIVTAVAAQQTPQQWTTVLMYIWFTCSSSWGWWNHRK